MNNSFRFSVQFVLVFVVMLVVAYFSMEVVIPVFFANVLLNSVIVSVGIFGLLYVSILFLRLTRVEGIFKKLDSSINSESIDGEAGGLQRCPSISGSLVDIDTFRNLIEQFETDLYFGPSKDVAKIVVGGINQRMKQQLDVTRYLMGVMVMLGLLGTFLGLVGTIQGIGATFAVIDSNDTGALISALTLPLKGMGTAFSTSLFGLSGSLILGVFGFVILQYKRRLVASIVIWFSQHITDLGASSGGQSDNMPEVVGSPMEFLVRLLSKSFDRLADRLSNEISAKTDFLAQTLLAFSENIAQNRNRLDHLLTEQQQAVGHLGNIEKIVSSAMGGLQNAVVDTGHVKLTATEVVNELRAVKKLILDYDQLESSFGKTGEQLQNIAMLMEQQTGFLKESNAKNISAINSGMQSVFGQQETISGILAQSNEKTAELVSTFGRAIAGFDTFERSQKQVVAALDRFGDSMVNVSGQQKVLESLQELTMAAKNQVQDSAILRDKVQAVMQDISSHLEDADGVDKVQGA